MLLVNRLWKVFSSRAAVVSSYSSKYCWLEKQPRSRNVSHRLVRQIWQHSKNHMSNIWWIQGYVQNNYDILKNKSVFHYSHSLLEEVWQKGKTRELQRLGHTHTHTHTHTHIIKRSLLLAWREMPHERLWNFFLIHEARWKQWQYYTHFSYTWVRCEQDHTNFPKT